MRPWSATMTAAILLAVSSGCASDDPTIASSVLTTSPVTTSPVTTSPVTTSPVTTSPVTTSPVTTDGPPAVLTTELESAGFGAQLSATHATMIDRAATADERARAGVEYQLLLRELADRPDLDEAVLTAADPSAQPALTQIVRARQFLQARSASRPPQPLPDELPAWTIIEPEPVDTLLAHYAEASELTGIPWYWLAAIHLQETRMGRIEGVSSAGAVGPMQFLPTTWAECCAGDPTVTRDAIIGAATYLMQSGGPDDMAAAVFEYNPNDGYVAVVTAYAESLRDEPELYSGYHAFQVFFGTTSGTVRLPIGYSEEAPIDAAAYLASNPQDAA